MLSYGHPFEEFKVVYIYCPRMGQAGGEDAYSVNVGKVHCSGGGCLLDVFQIDGDGVPALGHGIGIVESISILLEALGVFFVVDAASEGDGFC